MIERDRKALERTIYHIEMIKEYMKQLLRTWKASTIN